MSVFILFTCAFFLTPLTLSLAPCPLLTVLPPQVLWFRDFRTPPECLPDPCGGVNLNRGPNDLPFVPSAVDGQCYQLGQVRWVRPGGIEWDWMG